MTNSAKAKGNKFENDVCKVFNEFGFTAARIKAGWSEDQGDLEVAEFPEFVWQCKNYKDVAGGLRGGVDGAEQQLLHKPGARYPVAVVKRRSKPAEEAYAVMPLEQFIKLIERLKRHDDTE